MTPDEIEAGWERQTVGSPLKDTDSAKRDATDYMNFINDFITGRSAFDRTPPKSTSNMPRTVVSALKVFGLPITASWREISARYSALAKQHHPDTAKHKNAAAEFARISAAYDVLKKHFGKK